MIKIYKVLFISMLCILVVSCKSNSNTVKKEKVERTDTTEDIRDEQMQEYDQEMQQQNNQ